MKITGDEVGGGGERRREILEKSAVFWRKERREWNIEYFLLLWVWWVGEIGRGDLGELEGESTDREFLGE